jgi:hypothetical protein
MNAINVIAPYKYLDLWVFDDTRVGLVQEPFVSGADTMIDRVVAEIPDAASGFLLLFSSSPFPGHQLRLDWRRTDGGGNWYYSLSWSSRAGFARRCLAILSRRRGSYMFRSKPSLPTPNPALNRTRRQATPFSRAAVAARQLT